MGVAYRMLGSVADAENAVQEGFSRWYGLPEVRRAAVASPTGWLVTAVSRICLDVLGSARARRERYVGEWLPEPVPGGSVWTSRSDTAAVTDPAERVAIDESVTMAFLVMLDAMTPAERIAFVLHDLFQYPFAEVGSIMERSPAACRQLATAARRRIRSEHLPRPANGDDSAIVGAFASAWQTGNLERLVGLLDPDTVAVVDGGGLVSAALEPVNGADSVVGLLDGVRERQPDLTVRSANVNDGTGFVASTSSGEVLAVISIGVTDDGTIGQLWAVRNPQKLNTWRSESTS